ncbi:MAG TPA: hypothetical protein ENI13_00255 [candidate division CPR3 bacterium]|uniref:Uncharacterized protein n=1 Tax=candidate division CPR3 bacterium TaxID=2268181 RepID=A0A7C1NM75_UNCC3|nr:hypothetical protein [candidate division CPR3 bacterium]
MEKEYVGPGKSQSQKEEKGKTNQEQLKQIKIEKQELAEEKQEFEEEKDKFHKKVNKGDEDMEQQEVERELKVLKGNVEKLVGTVGEIAAVEKERQRQDTARKSKEEEDKRFQTIIDPLETAVKDVKEIQESQPKIHCASDGVCFTEPEKRDEYEAKLKQKKESPKTKKEDKLKTPGAEIVSEEDKELFGELTDMRAYYKGLIGEEAKRPVTIVAGVAKEALSKIVKSDPKAASDIVERFIPEKIVEEIKKGLTDVNSIKPEDKAKLFVQECQGPNAPAFCKILKEGGFNIQEKKKGSMPGSSGWKDIA